MQNVICVIQSVSLYHLKPDGNNMYHLLQQSVTLHFVFVCFIWFSVQTAIISSNSINQLISVMVKVLCFLCGTDWIPKYYLDELCNTKTFTYYGTKIKSETDPPLCNTLPTSPRDTRVKVTLFPRPLLKPVTQKLCRCEHGVFTSRTCVHSRTLLRIEIVCCCLWSI
jgi:hypothetical protein